MADLAERSGAEQLLDVAIATALAFGAAGFAAVGFFTGSASVEVAGGVVGISTDEIQWAAYAGLALAVLLAAEALVRYLAAARAHPAAPRRTAHRAA